MKWAHSPKGRTYKQTLSDIFKVPEDSVWQRNPGETRWYDCCKWGVTHFQSDTEYHSWDTMKECLKYGFDICDSGEIVAKEASLIEAVPCDSEGGEVCESTNAFREKISVWGDRCRHPDHF